MRPKGRALQAPSELGQVRQNWKPESEAAQARVRSGPAQTPQPSGEPLRSLPWDPGAERNRGESGQRGQPRENPGLVGMRNAKGSAFVCEAR